MTSQTIARKNFGIVVDAIIKNRKKRPHNSFSLAPKQLKLTRKEILDSLTPLLSPDKELPEKVKIYPESSSFHVMTDAEKDKESIKIDILPEFDHWLVIKSGKKNLNLSDFSQAYLCAIYELIQDIDNPSKAFDGSKICIPFVDSRERQHAREFLEQRGICLFFQHIQNYDAMAKDYDETTDSDYPLKFIGTELTNIDWNKFLEFRKELKKAYRPPPPTAEKGRFVPSRDDIVLDHEIVLHRVHKAKNRKKDKYFLVFTKKHADSRRNVTPKKADLIRHLYRIRRKSTAAESVSELSNVHHLGTRQEISNYIKHINKICDQVDTDHIFSDSPDHKWRLNPDLDCCELTEPRSQERSQKKL